jgi:glycine dehydrogenase subunit 1
MPFIQNTDEDTKAMLKAIGVASVEELFRDLPANLRLKAAPAGIPPSQSEADVVRDLNALTAKNRPTSDGATFLGGGIERHFIPHIVDHISLDGNFITAYTPYQPEVSQGTLTAIFQFQSMMTALTGLPVTNASLYDGATAVVEAVLVAYHYTAKNRRKETRNRVVVPLNVNPQYRETLATYSAASGFVVEEVGFDPATGCVDRKAFDAALAKGDCFAAVIAYPNFFGVVEDPRPLVAAAKAAGAVAVANAHALGMSVLVSPGEAGFDIAAGEGQPLGCYQALGGPAFGYFACSQDFIRFAPGRIVSETVDREGKRAYCLALATREQHIRREKATSNICTNQALMALRATIFMASWGKRGFEELGEQIASTAQYAAKAFEKAGIKRRFGGQAMFNEFVVEVPAAKLKAAELKARDAGITPGLDLGRFHKGLEGCQLVCVNELTTKTDIEQYVALFA